MLRQSLWSLAAAALFSLMAAFVKLCAGHFSTFELVFYRSLFGVISIAVFVATHHYTLATTHFWGHIKRSVMGTLSVFIWFMTLGLLPLSTNITLTYTTPLFMAANFILLAFLRHQKAPWMLCLSIITGFIGVVIALQPTFGSEMLVPSLLCLFVSFIDLIVYWQIKELGDLKEPSWRIVFYFTLFGTLGGAAGTFFFGGFHSISWESGACLAGIAVTATLAQLCTTRSYAAGNMLLSSCLGFSAIPFSALFGWLFFNDAITWLMIAGMTLIIAAGCLATITVKQQESRLKQKKRNTPQGTLALPVHYCQN